MNVTFHAVAALAISHATADALPRETPLRPRVVLPAFALAVLSHGVLDGLRHTYPLPAALDFVLALALFTGWTTRVNPWLRPMFALVFLGAVLPDVIDLGPAIVAHKLGFTAPVWPAVFPWHWREGSGSMYGVTGRARVVSWVNHALVLVSCGAVIGTRRGALRASRG